jgi:ribosomal protein S27E/endogenous inhibitor of DNA gyrase (YacG/DUF329 family)
MSKKLTYNYVKKQIEKTGYKLLSKEYKGSHIKLEVQCLEGHMYKVTWSRFQQGDRCPICANKIRANKRKLTYNYVKKFIKLKKYNLLSEKYKNARTKLELQCPEKHKFEMTWFNFRRGEKCPICAKRVRANKKTLTYNYVKKFIKSKGYKLLSKKYTNAYTKLRLRCPEKHEFEMIWASFQRGRRCPICDINKRRYTYEYVKEEIGKKGYKLLSKEYKGACIKLRIRCPKRHEFKMEWASFQQGHKCPICQSNSFSSRAEKEIANIVKIQKVKVKKNDRTQIVNPKTRHSLELDVFMPDLNKAIEYNGEYWHSFEIAVEHDEVKKRECIKKGIELLVIKERDWIDNKIGCINKIKDFVEDKTIISHLETT